MDGLKRKDTHQGDDDGMAREYAEKKRTKEVALSSLPNKLLRTLQDDHLYHLGLRKSMGFQKMFGDVRYVFVGGSASRIRRIANDVKAQLNVKLPLGVGLVPIGKSDRYELYKVGPVICVNHGMGQPSLSILLHELSKLLYYAEVENVMIIRVGTSGGVGVAPGTVVITTDAVDGRFRAVHETCELGIMHEHPSSFDSAIVNEIYDYAVAHHFKDGDVEYPIVKGKTICSDDFYTGQARADGAICPYSEDERMEYLRSAYDAGIRNFEMESALLAAFTNRIGIKSACICVTSLNRLECDHVCASHDLLEFDARASAVAVGYVQHHMSKHKSE